MQDKSKGRTVFTRRGLLAGIGVGALAMTAWQRGTTSPAALVTGLSGDLVLNDASELSPTPVWQHINIKNFDVDACSQALEAATTDGKTVIASAARHSMGGQSMAAEGMTITLDDDHVVLNAETLTYQVGGGTRWHQVIKTLDAAGFSPVIMQSNNDFGVASTFCVNAHGWAVPYSGCGSSVRWIDMILANGDQVRCSREERPEIFSAAMGGYGLLGIITKMELDMVPNQRLVPTFEHMSGDAFGPRFYELVTAQDGVSMAYGRLDVTHERFFQDAMAITYKPDPDQDDLPAVVGSGFMSKISRPVFRSQLENEHMKSVRWWMETKLATALGNGATTRNTLLNEPVITLDDADPTHADILHEYFLPPDTLHIFLNTCRRVIPNSYQQLLNVTLRFVSADRESLLSYAPEDRIAAVMLFSQEKTARSEADMARITRLLIEGALEAGGSYYLPYRLHALQDQFESAYPQAREFVDMKRRFDPDERFSNALWTTYLKSFS